MHRHTFTVEGTGNFPLDMLRYDSCYPSGTTDVWRIEENGDTTTRRWWRRIELAHTDGRKRWGPTTARWESFGWRVLCCEHY